jgi:hypothetical protein
MSTGWTPNDYSNLATVGAAALCSLMMVLFKSKCSKISLCCGLWSCDRKATAEAAEAAEAAEVPADAP